MPLKYSPLGAYVNKWRALQKLLRTTLGSIFVNKLMWKHHSEKRIIRIESMYNKIMRQSKLPNVWVPK
jgi:hypothetical protein